MTGPWRTLAEVPIGVIHVVDMRGREFNRGDHGWKPYYYKDGGRHHEFAPFMAVRERS